MAVRVGEQGSDYISKILSERRKAKKPLMEKLRRARINDSLNELKSLVLDALNKDVSRYSKMEKADILEMTVQYMRDLKREECKSQGQTRTAEYRAGYNQCAAEINRNLSNVSGADQLRSKLLSHLAQSCCQGNTPAAPVPVSRIGATSPVAAPETTSLCTSAPLTPIWIPYPSPPPSPVYCSPSGSPTLSPRNSSVDCTPFNASTSVVPVTSAVLHQEVNYNELTTHLKAKKPQVWRPW